MQLFLYDDRTKDHRQITFTKGSKDECSWSPCGNYIVYECRDGLAEYYRGYESYYGHS